MHLLEEVGRDRYRFHDLIRVYALERAGADETAEECDRALRRVLDWYLRHADAADRALMPHRRHIPLTESAQAIDAVEFPSPSAALQQVLMGLGAIYFIANICVTTWLLFTGMSATWQTVSSAARNSERRGLASQDLGLLYQRASQELDQMQAIVASQKARFLAGGRLSALTETLPARTWIAGISGDRKDSSIILQAEYLIDPDHPYELPAKEWMATLKKDPRFGNRLKKLEMASSSRRTQGNAELLSFELVAEWNPE